MNSFKNVGSRLRTAGESLRAKAVAVGTTAMVVAGSASAQSFDSSSIITKITDNALVATGIIGAFILAVWGLRSMGLLKGRG